MSFSCCCVSENDCGCDRGCAGGESCDHGSGFNTGLTADDIGVHCDRDRKQPADAALAYLN